MSGRVYVCDFCGQRLDDHAAAATHLLENHGVVERHTTVYDEDNAPPEGDR